MQRGIAGFVAGALFIAACSGASDADQISATTVAPATTTTAPSTTPTAEPPPTTLDGTPEERFVFMMRALASDIDEETWVDYGNDEDLALFGTNDCAALDAGTTFEELADENAASAAELNLTEADYVLSIQGIILATMSICPQHFDAGVEWFESELPSATAPSVYSIQEPGYWIDAAPVQDGDITGGFCSGYRAALYQMTITAQEEPEDFYPLPDPQTLTCPDYEPGSFTIEQAFCEGWASHTIFGTITLSDSPDTEATMDLLFESCMGATFGMNPDTTQAYDFLIYEHNLYDLGLVCYPEDSHYWINNPDIPPRFPWVTMCEN